MKTDRELLKEANELIRSFNSIIERKGLETNWDGINKQVKRVLKEHHELKLFAIPVVSKNEAESEVTVCPKCGKSKYDYKENHSYLCTNCGSGWQTDC